VSGGGEAPNFRIQATAGELRSGLSDGVASSAAPDPVR
jgi:hypothetical protein